MSWVYVLCHGDLGWDCVCQVSNEMEGLMARIYEDDYPEETVEQWLARWEIDEREAKSSYYILHKEFVRV